jgi:hypothetical protein
LEEKVKEKTGKIWPFNPFSGNMALYIQIKIGKPISYRPSGLDEGRLIGTVEDAHKGLLGDLH